MLSGNACSSGLTRTTTSCRKRQDGNREEKVSTCYGRKGKNSFVVLYDSSSHKKMIVILFLVDLTVTLPEEILEQLVDVVFICFFFFNIYLENVTH